MGKESIKVLHIDTEKGWRGGQQQAAYLIDALFKNGFHTSMVCQPHSVIQKFCKNQGLPCFAIRMLGEIDFVSGFRIARLCRKSQVSILHLHSAHALAIGLWTKLFYPKLKLIGVRRVDFHIHKNWLSQLKYRSRKLDRIVCISEAIRQILIADGIPAEKLVTIHSGIDIHKFDGITPPTDFRAQLGIPRDHILIGTIAAMAGHKDYPNLLQAAKIVCEKFDRVTFCTVGDGPEKERIFKLAKELGIDTRFIFAGYRNDIGNFLKSFDIFVLASKKEGLGTSLLDAQAVGLPIVACETGGIPEIIGHGINGWLVPAQNENALAVAIMKLIRQGGLRKKLGLNALQSVKKFDIQFTIEKNIQLYENLVSE